MNKGAAPAPKRPAQPSPTTPHPGLASLSPPHRKSTPTEIGRGQRCLSHHRYPREAKR